MDTHREWITRRQLALGGAAALAVGAGGRAAASEFGRFEDDFVGRFVGRQKAVVERPLTYVDPDGAKWTAPAGTEVNGASIPRALWTIVGSPFSGDYLRASVVHDHYCVTMERDWKATHLAFYNGCRADGLSKTFANLLYAGVMRFGPRWQVGRGLTGLDGRPRRREPAFNAEEFQNLRQWLEEGDRSLEEINARLQS